MVSTYQAGKVLVIGVHDQQLQISFLDFDQPMGIAVGPDRIAIGAKSEVQFLKANHAAVATVAPQNTYSLEIKNNAQLLSYTQTILFR